MDSGRSSNDRVALLGLVAAVAVGSVGGLLWLAGQLSAVLMGHGWPDSSVGAQLVPVLKTLVTAPGDPARAWPEAVAGLIGPPWLVYLLFVVLLAPVVAVSAGLVRFALNWRRRRGWRHFRLGFASGWEIRRLLGARAVLRRGRMARPALRGRRHPLDVGYFLGRDYRSRQRLYSSVEDAVLIVAPPRQGKDVHFCTPFTIDAPGPCVVVTTGVEAFVNTYELRRRMGRVYVFDPHRMTHWPDRMRWSPVRGAEDPDAADDRAKTLLQQTGYVQGKESEIAVVNAALLIMRCYLHAAALHGRGVRDILGWIGDPRDPEPVELLRRAGQAGVGAAGWAQELETATTTGRPDVLASRLALVAQSLSCLFDPAVQAEFSPEENETFDLREFVSGRNTLYVLAKERGTNPIAPLLTIMIEDFLSRLRAMAARGPGGRMEPPVTFELNEAALSLAMKSLPRFMGLAGRSSIALHVYLRSLGQARAVWGEDGAATMWDNAAWRIVAGGAGTIDDLEEVSSLLGDIYRPDGTKVGRRILTADEIRTMRFGHAVVVGREARPVELTLTPWWKRRDHAAIAAGKRDTEARIQEYAERAERSSPVHRYVRRSPA